MLLVELCSKKSYFIVSEINAEGSYIRMSGVQLHARISFKAQSNWMLSKYFFPSLDMKLSGDSTQYFFLRKIFSLPMKANARYKYIWSFWSFFFFFIVCFCLTFCDVHSFWLELDEIASLLHWGFFFHIDQIHHLSSQVAENPPRERDHHARN